MSVLSYVKRPRHAVDDVLMADIRSRLSQPRPMAQTRAKLLYRAGKAPQWAAATDNDDGGGGREAEASKAVEVEASTSLVAPPLVAAPPSSSSFPPLPGGGSGGFLAPPSDESDEASAAWEAAARRRRAAERRAAAQTAAADAEAETPPPRPTEANDVEAAMEEEAEDGSDSNSASSSSPSSPASPPPRPLFAPVFRRAAQRSTRREGGECGGEAGQGYGSEEAEVEGQRVRRREVTLEALQRSMRREEESDARRAKGAGLSGEAAVDDSDDWEGEEAEREMDEWKLRELRRIERDRSLAQRWRTAQEGGGGGGVGGGLQRLDGDDGDGEAATAPPSSTSAPGRYLQRYYHTGAFFTDERAAEPAVFSRNFQQATGEDREMGDRRLLPAVLQVKRFGLKGRTKYTHLTDQDTSRRSREGEEGRPPPPVREVGVRGYQGRGVGNG